MPRLTTLGTAAAAALLLAFAAAGGENGNRPAAPAATAAPDPFHWGEAAGGLQLGLVPTGRGDTPEVRNVYFEGEGLKFTLYLKNTGEADLTLLHASLLLPDFRILVTPKAGGKALTARYDAAALPRNAAALTAPVRLARGGHGTCAVEFDARWRFEETEGAAAKKALPVGKYTLQVVYEPQLAKDEAGWRGRALTGSVDVEVRARPAAASGGSGGGGGRVGGGGGGGGRLPPGIVRPL